MVGRARVHRDGAVRGVRGIREDHDRCVGSRVAGALDRVERSAIEREHDRVEGTAGGAASRPSTRVASKVSSSPIAPASIVGQADQQHRHRFGLHLVLLPPARRPGAAASSHDRGGSPRNCHGIDTAAAFRRLATP